MPTRAPSAAPTPKAEGHLDVYFVLDRSLSIKYDAPACVNVTLPPPLVGQIDLEDLHADMARASAAAAGDPSGGALLPRSKRCWDLMLAFAARLVAAAVTTGAPAIGWAGDRSNPNEGLRVSMLGFACEDDQTVPLVFQYGVNMQTQAEFAAGLATAALQTPFGGTCPHLAMEHVVELIQSSLNRPDKAVVFATDGVLYDPQDVQRATDGLRYFGANMYVLGVALPLVTYPGGLKPWQIKRQQQQLGELAGPGGQVYNLGADGFALLPAIADLIADRLPGEVMGKPLPPAALLDPFWCGYTDLHMCQFPGLTEYVCSWGGLACSPKPRCAYPESFCGDTQAEIGIDDPTCAWTPGVGCGVSGRDDGEAASYGGAEPFGEPAGAPAPGAAPAAPPTAPAA